MQVAIYAASPDPVNAEAATTFAETTAYLTLARRPADCESDLERSLHGRGQELIRLRLQGHLDQREVYPNVVDRGRETGGVSFHVNTEDTLAGGPGGRRHHPC